MQYKRPESVLVVIYDTNNQVLVMQRDDDVNFWQSVTGTIEEHEQPRQTAIREVKEETGIDLAALNSNLIDCETVNNYLIRQSWLHRYPPGTLRNNEHVFCVQVPNQLPIVLTEHLAFKWQSKNDAIQTVWSQTNKNAILNHVPE